MSTYVRPPLPKQTFYDADGAVIDYGNRWRDRAGRMPPDDTYSVVSNPQRFAPLHTVADALIEHLMQNYDVTVVEDPAVAADLLHDRDDVRRAVRLTPANPNAAPLTFVFTSFPGLVVHAGVLHDFVFPDCGCDACDETAETAAAELERVVPSVVAGGYAESVGTAAEQWVAYALVDPDGNRRGRGQGLASVPPDRWREAQSRLRSLPDGWEPWPSRTGNLPARPLRPASEIPPDWLTAPDELHRRPGSWQAWPGSTDRPGG